MDQQEIAKKTAQPRNTAEIDWLLKPWGLSIKPNLDGDTGQIEDDAEPEPTLEEILERVAKALKDREGLPVCDFEDGE